jgi:hypothetical protein
MIPHVIHVYVWVRMSSETSVPTAYFDLPPLVPDQPYDISIHLTVPYTESNLALGQSA